MKLSDDDYASSWILLDHMSSYWWRKKNAKIYIHIYCCIFVYYLGGRVSILRPQKSYQGYTENKNPLASIFKMDGLNLYSSKYVERNCSFLVFIACTLYHTYWMTCFGFSPLSNTEVWLTELHIQFCSSGTFSLFFHQAGGSQHIQGTHTHLSQWGLFSPDDAPGTFLHA